VDELDDAADHGLTVRDAVDRLWTDYADHYAHQPSLRKAIYEVLGSLIEAGRARGEGLAKRGQGARYYTTERATPAESEAPRALSH
jgi:aryl-alcohol dehydrogenase-like predicted oxidoreductase